MADKRKLIPEGARSVEGRRAWEKFAAGALVAAGHASLSHDGIADHAAAVADRLLTEEWMPRWVTPTVDDDGRLVTGLREQLTATMREWEYGQIRGTWPEGYDARGALQACGSVLRKILQDFPNG